MSFLLTPFTSFNHKVFVRKRLGNFVLGHRFLTWGPWRGSRGSAKISKVKESTHLNLFLQGFRGPPVVPFDTLGVRGIFFAF